MLAFHQNGVKGFDTSIPENIPIGARIPAVFVYSEHQGSWSRYQLSLVQTGIGRPCESNFLEHLPKCNPHILLKHIKFNQLYFFQDIFFLEIWTLLY